MVELREGSALLHLMRTRDGSVGAPLDGPSGGSAPNRSVSTRSASTRSASTRSASTRSAPSRSAPNRSASRLSDEGTPSSQPPAADRQPPAAEGSGPTITCGFCGQEFVEDPSQATCQACPLKKSCGLMRCPHCGYENAREPGWIAKLKEWIG